MFKDHKFPALKAAEHAIYNEISEAIAFSHYRF
jgi:hypothetical protein